MNVLLLTNHLKDYAGSEIQILELYNFFKKTGCKVTVFANLVDDPIRQHFDNNDICHNICDIDLYSYQLIWSQHGIFPLLFSNKNIKQPITALIISAHLSPFENMELLQIPYMNNIHAYFIANSEETSTALKNFGIPPEKIYISYNCAPIEFRKNLPPPHKLRRLAIISNHPPPEIIAATSLLQKKYEVDCIGYNYNFCLVTPELLSKYDCIITIGKTVQYALLGNKPVYCYDCHGGPGYLNKENFSTAQYYNFSGRGFSKKTTNQIVEEIENQFHRNKIFFATIHNKDLYILETFLHKILTLNPISVSENQQLLLEQFSPASKKICDLYLSNHFLSRDLDNLSKKLNFNKTKFNIIIILLLFFFLVTLLSIKL